MDELPILAAPEARVLGSLLEKERTTPDVYPLTLNSLRAACNQASNRTPVVQYDDTTVVEALDGLRAKGLARLVHSTSNRAVKYRHVVAEVLGLQPEETALLCVLLLRGPQTVGELRSRTERLHPFESIGEIEATLDRLVRRDPPLVVRLARQPGQKEPRVAQLLTGVPAEPEAAGFEPQGVHPPQPRPPDGLADEVAQLRLEVDELRDELRRLREALEG